MNKLSLETLLLLEQSGELTPQQERELKTLMATSDDAMHARSELERLVALAREPDVSLTPGHTMQNILETARPERQTSQKTIAWPVRSLLALAATLLLVAGLWFVLDENSLNESSQQAQASSSSYDWNGDFDEDLDQLSELIASIDEEWKMDDLDQVAAELLELEGKTI